MPDLREDILARLVVIAAKVPDNAAFTEVVLELVPLVGGPFETNFHIPVSPLGVRRTLTL